MSDATRRTRDEATFAEGTGRRQRPVIVAVDDDADVLAAVRRDLRRRYGDDYRIVAADGGPQGLAAVTELHRRGASIAVMVVDQRMPELEGTDLLVEAKRHYPEAKSVLLTAYADTDAAIQSINQVGLDHYLMKPWQPPDELLYPIVDELLDDWHAAQPPAIDGIRVLGARWDAAAHDIKDFLARNQIPYRFLDVEHDDEGRSLLTTLDDRSRLPAVVLPDGQVLAAPVTGALAAAIGLTAQARSPFYDLIIIGAGPAGLAAAVYGASEGLDVAVLERSATGGQAGSSSRIENYLGFPNGVSGGDLARRATAQARRLGAEILHPVEVTGVRAEGPARVVTLDDGRELTAHAVVVATGMRMRELGVDGVAELTGAGVYYGATLPEAAAYRGERVVIVGGANSAGQAAVMFSRYAAEVVMVVRAGSLAEKMSTYLVDQIAAIDAIRVLTSAHVARVEGDGHLETVVLIDADGDTVIVEATGMFVFVGAVPHSDFLQGVVAVNEQGFIPTGPDISVNGSRPRGWRLERDPYLLETSVPGIFAAGDVRDQSVRRVASAVGQGAICVSFVHRYLATI